MMPMKIWIIVLLLAGADYILIAASLSPFSMHSLHSLNICMAICIFDILELCHLQKHLELLQHYEHHTAWHLNIGLQPDF